MSELHSWDAVETAARLAANEVTASEVVDAAIERAEDARHLHGLVTPTYDLARERARDPGTGPFAGVPSAIKDLSHVAGVPTGNGSRAWQGHVPTHSDDSVLQFQGLGFVSLGKSGAPEFGLTPSGEPVGLDHIANPWAPSHSPGGSSSGAAALVAAGVVPVAFASDGGGSIRIPAANCGLVGLKPSHRRLALLPDMDRLPVPIATYGIVSRTVRDTAAFHAAAERQDPVPGLARIGDVTGPSTRRLRIGVTIGRADGAPLHPDVRTAVEDAAAACADLGHDVDYVEVPFSTSVGDDFVLYWGLLAQGILLLSRQTLGSAFDRDGFDTWTHGLAANARRNAHRIPGAIRRLRAFRAEHERFMASWDVMITATLGTPPPPIGWIDPSIDFDLHLERVLEYVPYTVPQNISGLPAVSLPMGRTAPTTAAPQGLPIGVMFGGGVGEERTLLELAYELEQAHPWPLVAPRYLWAP